MTWTRPTPRAGHALGERPASRRDDEDGFRIRREQRRDASDVVAVVVRRDDPAESLAGKRLGGPGEDVLRQVARRRRVRQGRVRVEARGSVEDRVAGADRRDEDVVAADVAQDEDTGRDGLGDRLLFDDLQDGLGVLRARREPGIARDPGQADVVDVAVPEDALADRVADPDGKSPRPAALRYGLKR